MNKSFYFETLRSREQNTNIFVRRARHLSKSSTRAACLPLLLPILEFLRKYRHCRSRCLFYRRTQAGAFSPPAPTQASTADAAQERPSRRHQRTRFSGSLSRMNFELPAWSQLSSTTTSKVNAETGGGGERSSRTVRNNRTVMTVSHDEGTRGVHVQLRREFRFVSPPTPGPEPLLMHSRQQIELAEVRNAPTEEETLTVGDEGSSLAVRTEKGKGKAVERAVEELGSDIDTDTETMTTALEWPDAEKQMEQPKEPAQPKSEALKRERTRTTLESQDYAEGSSTAPPMRNQPEEPVNYTRGV